MKKITEPEKLANLLAKDEIIHLNIKWTIELIDEYELFVDNRETPQGYVLQKRDWNIFYADNEEAEKILLADLLDKPQKFAGVMEEAYEAIARRREIDWQEKCFLYFLDPDDFTYQEPEHEVDNLKPADAKIVDQHYTYRNPDSLDYIKKCIDNFPTAVVRDEKDQPLSWALVREDGSLGIAYTKKDYRRQGLALSVNTELTKRAIEFGLKPYVHIVIDNFPSQRLAESLGFKRYCKVFWFATK